MWEEDPRWQQVSYRLLVSAVAIGVVGGFVVALWSGDWRPYQMFLEVLGVKAKIITARFNGQKA